MILTLILVALLLADVGNRNTHVSWARYELSVAGFITFTQTFARMTFTLTTLAGHAKLLLEILKGTRAVCHSFFDL